MEVEKWAQVPPRAPVAVKTAANVQIKKDAVAPKTKTQVKGAVPEKTAAQVKNASPVKNAAPVKNASPVKNMSAAGGQIPGAIAQSRPGAIVSSAPTAAVRAGNGGRTGNSRGRAI
ncbi:hypothetical protein ON010_g4892 [Phytophthora cinnamomi]|nr:hypothetical protein ON010_g4892 [Phytophthora cinnamomi]